MALARTSECLLLVDELEPGVSNIVIFEPTSPKIPFENGTSISIKSPTPSSAKSLITSKTACSYDMIESKDSFNISFISLPNASVSFNPS